MKTLLVYYSQKGNTKKIVDLLKEKIEADIFDAATDRVYDDDDWKAADQALAEIQSGTLPELINEIPDFTSYDSVIIGGPVWGQSLSNPIRRFFQDADLSGKKVSGFWTFWDHDEHYSETMSEECKKQKAVYVEGLSMPRVLTGNKKKLDEAIDSWLQTL
ncbi:Flavodoxin [Lachnospiraceae bacterium TWA4]|nr:Flavodoxin [Lachnospiraceae bacterium TWA4]